eukprot:scaffold25947_cov62-Phaeocystis_antarctica.AAC.2
MVAVMITLAAATRIVTSDLSTPAAVAIFCCKLEVSEKSLTLPLAVSVSTTVALPLAFGGGDDAVGGAWAPLDTGVGGVGCGGGAGGGGHTTASTAGAESFSSTVTPRSLERTLRLRLATSPTSVLTSSLVVWTRKVTVPPFPWSRVTVAVEATSAPAWRLIRFTNACTSAASSAGVSTSAAATLMLEAMAYSDWPTGAQYCRAKHTGQKTWGQIEPGSPASRLSSNALNPIDWAMEMASWPIHDCCMGGSGQSEAVAPAMHLRAFSGVHSTADEEGMMPLKKSKTAFVITLQWSVRHMPETLIASVRMEGISSEMDEIPEIDGIRCVALFTLVVIASMRLDTSKAGEHQHGGAVTSIDSMLGLGVARRMSVLLRTPPSTWLASSWPVSFAIDVCIMRQPSPAPAQRPSCDRRKVRAALATLRFCSVNSTLIPIPSSP